MQAHEGPLSGRAIGYTVRWSTKGQTNNERGRVQDEEMPAIIRRLGGEPRPYHEGAQSGRDLSRRKRALDLLADVASGAVQGIGGWDVKRLTRDDSGLDAGQIIRICRKQRALIVTAERVYEVWKRRDLRDFKRDAMDAGENLLDIRDTFWEGYVGRVKREAFFAGLPPVGYTTYTVEIPPSAPGERTKIKRYPKRDEACAPMMGKLAEAFDLCQTAGQVARYMNDAGLMPTSRRFRTRGALMPWTKDRVVDVLRHPLYAGQWVWGRFMAPDSEIRQLPSVQSLNYGAIGPDRGATTMEGAPLVLHDVPDLAWYAPADLDAWRDKLIAQSGPKQVRARKHPHMLLGVLNCPTCHAPMCGHGTAGYSCPNGRLSKVAGGCSAPANIVEGRALDALWSLLPSLHKERADADQLALAALADGDALRAKQALRQTLRTGLDASIDQFTDDNGVCSAPDKLVEKWKATKRLLDELQAEIVRMERSTVADERQVRMARLMVDQPERARDKMPVAAQCAMFRDIVDGVELRGTGKTNARRYEVVRYHNRMIGSSVTGETAGSWARYLQTEGD